MKAPPQIVDPGMDLRAASRGAWDAFVLGLGDYAHGLTIALAHTDPSLLARQQGYCAALLDLHSVLEKIEKHHENLMMKANK
jgi:hypothetical protein